jgi:hypothetical protein
MGEAIEFSKMLAESSMVPRAYQGKPQDIMVCVQWGYELGLAPMQALQNIAVINGKPSVYGDAMAALVQASPVCEGIEETLENEGSANPVAVCIAKRKNRTPVIAKFSVEDAKRAGLWGKQGPWTAYPKRMLQMRARGFALRDAFPDVLKGLISAEEAEDFPTENNGKSIKDITPMPANPLDRIAPPIEVAQMVQEVQTIIAERPVEELIDLGKAFVDAIMEVEPVELQNDSAESAEPFAEPAGIPLLVPKDDGTTAVHCTMPDLESWANTYEDIADKTARAGKRTPRERMSVLKKLRDLNQETLNQMEQVKKLRHSAAYAKRNSALGAAMPIEKTPEG